MKKGKKAIVDRYELDMECSGQTHSEVFKDFNAVTALHEKLITASETAQTVQLFLCIERGRFYRT